MPPSGLNAMGFFFVYFLACMALFIEQLTYDRKQMMVNTLSILISFNQHGDVNIYL